MGFWPMGPMPADVLPGTGLVRRGVDQKEVMQGIRSYDYEGKQPHLSTFNAVICEFQAYANASPKASKQVFKEAKDLLRLEAEWRQLVVQGAVGYTQREVAAMLVQAISPVRARLMVAEAAAVEAAKLAAAAAAKQQRKRSGKSIFIMSSFLRSVRAWPAPTGPTLFGCLAGNPKSLFCSQACIPSGTYKGYTPPKPAALCISAALAACTAEPSSNSSSIQGVDCSSAAGVDAGSDSRRSAGGMEQQAAAVVIAAVAAAEGQARAGKSPQARSSGSRRSSDSSSNCSIGGGSNAAINFLAGPMRFRSFTSCGITRAQPLQAHNSTATGGQHSGGVSGMLCAPASRESSTTGGRDSSDSRASIGSVGGSSVECGSLLRNSNWDSSSLGGASSVQRSISSSGSLPGASLELLPALPAAGGNVCGAAVSGNSGRFPR